MPIEDRLKKERTSDFAYGAVGTYAKGAVRTRALPAIGLEAEFATVVDDVLARPYSTRRVTSCVVRSCIARAVRITCRRAGRCTSTPASSSSLLR